MMKPSHIKSIQNTLYLFKLWDHKYTQKGQTEIFSGSVDQYQFKKISDSQFIILKNPSRIEKKVNKIQKSIEKQMVKSSKPKISKVYMELKEEDFYFQKILPEQVAIYLDSRMETIVIEEGTSLLKRGYNIKDQEVHSIIVNKVPICRYNCLFVPWINGKSTNGELGSKYMKLQQKIIIKALPLALDLLNMYEDLIVGFNSVGAAASVNNLHFHMFFKEFWIGEHAIPISVLLDEQKTQKRCIYSIESMKIETFDVQLIQGFEVNIYAGYNQLSIDTIYKILNRCLSQNIPHNILFLKKESSYKVLIFPRNFEKQETKFAFMELSGVFCLDYQNTTKETIQRKLLEMKLAKQTFQNLVQATIEDLYR